MVLPPNRIGASRGPNGSTLDDVVAAINGLVAVQQDQSITLASIQSFLDNIADDIAVLRTQLTYDPTYIPPEDEPVTLAQYLRWLWGSPQVSQFDGLDLAQRFFSIDATLRLVSQNQQAYNNATITPPNAGANYPGGFLLRAAEALDELVNSTGVRGSSPTNLSQLAYLALIADSTERSADCCEENSQPGGGGENPPPGPSFSCGLESTPYRATSYEFRRNLPADQLDEYIVMFTGFSSQSPSGFTETVSNDTVPLPCYEGPANAQLCWEWNLSSGQVPGQVLVYESSPGGLFSPVIGTNVGVTQGEGSTAILTLAGAGEKYMLCVRVAENSGVPQHLNYWIDRNGPPA